MKNNLKELMEKAQELQASMQAAQKELADTFVIGEAGGGLVKIKMSGQHDAKAIRIKAAAAKGMDPADIKMLEDLVRAAINDAVKKVDRVSKAKVTDLASSMGGLPDDFKMPTDIDDDK